MGWLDGRRSTARRHRYPEGGLLLRQRQQASAASSKQSQGLSLGRRTGGTAVTRGTLHTALTPGAWHILEFRNLDLSTWTAAGCGLYTSYVLNGAIGKIELFASGQDAARDKARARMAAYFGVTLP